MPPNLSLSKRETRWQGVQPLDSRASRFRASASHVNFLDIMVVDSYVDSRVGNVSDAIIIIMPALDSA